jgi:hypothetical protein
MLCENVGIGRIVDPDAALLDWMMRVLPCSLASSSNKFLRLCFSKLPQYVVAGVVTVQLALSEVLPWLLPDIASCGISVSV